MEGGGGVHGKFLHILVQEFVYVCFLSFLGQKKKLKILSFYLYQVKAIFKLLACLQLDRPLCFENRTRLFHNA